MGRQMSLPVSLLCFIGNYSDTKALSEIKEFQQSIESCRSDVLVTKKCRIEQLNITHFLYNYFHTLSFPYPHVFNVPSPRPFTAPAFVGWLIFCV